MTNNLGRRRPSANGVIDGAVTIALSALAAALADARRARRFLDMTGLEAEELRKRASEPAILAALLAFLEGHKPDLIEVADALALDPIDLVAARRQIISEGPSG